MVKAAMGKMVLAEEVLMSEQAIPTVAKCIELGNLDDALLILDGLRKRIPRLITQVKKTQKARREEMRKSGR